MFSFVLGGHESEDLQQVGGLDHQVAQEERQRKSVGRVVEVGEGDHVHDDREGVRQTCDHDHHRRLTEVRPVRVETSLYAPFAIAASPWTLHSVEAAA